MRAVVVFESMYGNTHLIADAIGQGLRDAGDVAVVPVAAADASILDGADLVVVGGPTHAHGMSRRSTRQAALDAAREPSSDLTIDADAARPGLRDWFEALDRLPTFAAAFDTRLDAPMVLTGRASKGIARQLRKRGSTLLAEPMSFLVTKENHLEPEESARAVAWGTRLASQLVAQQHGATNARRN